MPSAFWSISPAGDPYLAEVSGAQDTAPTIRPPRPCNPTWTPRPPAGVHPARARRCCAWLGCRDTAGPRVPRRGSGRCTHLALLHGHGLPAGRDLLIDAGQEVLRDAERVLQQRVVRVAGGRVLQQVLRRGKGRVRAADALGGCKPGDPPLTAGAAWWSTVPGGSPERSPQANAVCTLPRWAPRCSPGAGFSSQGREALGGGSPVPCKRLAPSLTSGHSIQVVPTRVWRCQAKLPLDVFRVHLDHPGALICARSGESPQPSRLLLS